MMKFMKVELEKVHKAKSTVVRSNETVDRKRPRREYSTSSARTDSAMKIGNHQRQKHRSDKHVTFSDEGVKEGVCSDYFYENMNEDDERAIREQLWYSRQDFKDFLRDIASTIQLLRSVGGNIVVLKAGCPNVCLRGLEPYQYEGLNYEIQCQRELHQKTVLMEQQRQNQLGIREPDNIRCLAYRRSDWARQRAQQLAALDVSAAKEVTTETSSLFPASLPYVPTKTGVNRRNILLPLSNVSASSLLSMSMTSGVRRTSLSMGRTLPFRRIPVDVGVLKEMNARFLQDIRNKELMGAIATQTWRTPVRHHSEMSRSSSTSSSTLNTDRLLAAKLFASRLVASRCTC